jgi:hypothetical protein
MYNLKTVTEVYNHIRFANATPTFSTSLDSVGVAFAEDLFDSKLVKKAISLNMFGKPEIVYFVS